MTLVTRSLPGCRSSSFIGPRVVNSLFLLLLASVVSIPLSLWLGAQGARRRDTVFDNVTSNATLALASLPEFVVGIILILVFSLRIWHLLPAVSTIDIGKGPWSDMKGMVLPTATLVIGAVPYIITCRSGLDDRGAGKRLRRDGPTEGEHRRRSCCGGMRCRTRSDRSSRSSR